MAGRREAGGSWRYGEDGSCSRRNGNPDRGPRIGAAVGDGRGAFHLLGIHEASSRSVSLGAVIPRGALADTECSGRHGNGGRPIGGTVANLEPLVKMPKARTWPLRSAEKRR
jgi:hypothetical protein